MKFLLEIRDYIETKRCIKKLEDTQKILRRLTINVEERIQTENEIIKENIKTNNRDNAKLTLKKLKNMEKVKNKLEISIKTIHDQQEVLQNLAPFPSLRRMD